MSIAGLVRRVRGTATLRERKSDGVTPLVVDDAGLRYAQDSNTRTVADLEQNQTFSGVKTFTGGSKGVPWKSFTSTDSADITVTAADTGGVWIATKSSATQTFALPATALGLTFTFICGHADGEINISPDAADKITGKGFATADNGDIKNTAASNAVGDTCTLVGDGADGWIGTVVTGTWANV